MKIEYYNLYTYFILITQNGLPRIIQSPSALYFFDSEKNRNNRSNPPVAGDGPYYLSNKRHANESTLLPYLQNEMKIEYYNLYTYFILITQNGLPRIIQSPSALN